MILAKLNFFIDGNGKGSPGLSHSKEIQKEKFQSWKWSLVDISVSRSVDKSEIINSFELRKVAGRVGGMG